MASAESVAAVIEAGGAHVPELMERLEARLAELARSHGAVLAEHAGSDDRRRRQAAAAAAGVRGRRARSRATPTRCCAPPSRSSSCTPRRSSTTTCSTRRRCGAGGRPSWPPRAARWRPRRATCCSRARSRSWPRGGSAEAVRVLSDASSALAQGELLQREDAWDADDHARALRPRAATSRPRGCSRPRAGSARSAAAATPSVLGRFGRSIGLAFQLLDDVLDVSGPAERTGKHRGTDLLDGTVTLPLILARERDPGARRRWTCARVRTPQQAERGVRRDRRHGRAGGRARARRWRWSRRPRPRCRRSRRPSRERSSWWPTASSTVCVAGVVIRTTL